MSTLTDFGGRPQVADGQIEVIGDYKNGKITIGIGRATGPRWLDMSEEQAALLARKLFGQLPPVSQPLSPMTVRAITRALSRDDAPFGSDILANERALADFRRLIAGEE